jgi:organic radical activating enzyme
MKKINEIFYSLQGEGFYTGTAAIFIRFSGCNLKCDFCDTLHESGEFLSDEEILQKISHFESKHIVLTGGEPSLWIDEEFVGKLKSIGYYVQIETNGTHPIPQNVDWITCSPKDAPLAINKANELKVVFTSQSFVEKFTNFNSQHRFLQPLSCGNTAEVVDYILKHPQWRMSLQTHKLINIQ